MTDQPLNENTVAELPAPAVGNRLHYFSNDKLQGEEAPAGFAVRVTAAGTKSFVWFHRVGGKPYLETLGRWKGTGGSLSVLEAIVEADKREKAIRKDGADPRPPRTRRVQDGAKPGGVVISDLLDDYVARYLKKEAGLRSADAIERVFERLVKPAIGQIGIYDLKRSQVVSMLDDIADESGPVMADRTLAYLRKAFNWRAARDDEFNTPIAKGMARTKPSERARDRVLADDEIRELWSALDHVPEPTCYARFVRFLLYTASRRDEAAAMRWDELQGKTWTIPAARYKNKRDHVVPLTDTALGLLGNKPKDHAKRPFVFSTTSGLKAFSGYSKAKAILDKKIAEGREKAGRKAMPRWTLHDLRRTARSLMSRAGVSADHAERAIGHTIAGVRGVYDRHAYLDEKQKAFEALASLITQILNPVPNVTQIAGKRRNRAGG